MDTFSDSEREGIKAALPEGLAPFLSMMGDDASLSGAIRMFTTSDDMITPFLSLTTDIDFTSALSTDERVRVAAAVKTATIEAACGGKSGTVAVAPSAEQRAVIVRVLTEALTHRMVKKNPSVTAPVVELTVEMTLIDDNALQKLLAAIDGINLEAMSEEDERRVQAAVHAVDIGMGEEEVSVEEEGDATNATTTLSDVQRAALLDALADAALPFMPTMDGHHTLVTAARKKALEMVYNVAHLKRFLPLAKTMDFTQMTAGDKRRVALGVKKVMYDIPDSDDLYKGSPVEAMSETEREAVARVLSKAMPGEMAYLVPGLPKNSFEIMVDRIMQSAKVMQKLLDATSGINFAALSEEDELRAVAALTNMEAKDEEKEQSTSNAAEETPAVEREKEKEKALGGACSDDDSLITRVDFKGVDADGNLRGAVAATLGEEERAAIARVIAKTKPRLMSYSIPNKLVDVPFEELIMASDEDLQKFLNATKDLSLVNLSEKDEARAVAVAKYAFFGEDEPEQEAEEPAEDTPTGDVAALRALSERQRAVVEALVAGSQKLYGFELEGEDLANAARSMLEDKRFAKSFMSANRGVTFSDEAKLVTVTSSVRATLFYDSDDE